MQSEMPVSNTNGEALKGLPPVQPPSGKFLAQLFLIPLGIVAVAVCILLFLNWLVGGSFTPEQMLRDLRSGNTDVRWRRASDLAQVLKRDSNLAANPTFALSIEELLRDALRESDQNERAYRDKLRNQAASKTKAETRPDVPKEIRDERSFLEFLISCTGNFSIPVGVPLLNEIALKEDGADPETMALRRQLAVWSLATVADNLKRFDALPAGKRAEVLSELATESESAESSSRRQLARTTHDFLAARAEGRHSALGVDQALERCAASDDLDLRKFVALALTFWEGTPEENERMEQTLLKLSDPTGASDSFDAVKLREVRFQSAEALARRGSKKVSERLPLLREMLDEESLTKIFRTKTRDQKDVADTAIIGVLMTDGLKSVAELHRKLAARGETGAVDLTVLMPGIEKLAKHDNPAVRVEAERTLLELKR